jgi:ABC-type sugar transport system substrate-binding protein
MKKLLVSLFTLMLVVGLLAGCVSSDSGKSNDKKSEGDSDNSELSIAVVPKLVGIPYFNASEKGAINAGEKLGVDVQYTGPTQADAAAQVKTIEDLISKNVDVIAVAPNDPASVEPVLNKAKDQGIIVMDWDTPANNVDLSVKQVDDEEFGRHLAKKLVEAMGTEEGEIAILTGGLSAANLNSWIDAAMKEFEENYPGIKIIGEKIPTDEKQQVAYQKTLDLIKANPNLKGILAVSTPAPLGAAQAIQEEGLQDKIAVVGSALPTDSGPFLEDGSLDVAVLWDPGKLGHLTVALAKILAEGGEIKDGMEVEGVGPITVLEDGKTVIMGPPADFTKDNYGDYNF